MWSLQIRNFHRRDVRAWKTGQFQTFLGTARDGKTGGNFCLDPMENTLWHNLAKMFLHAGGRFVCLSDAMVGETDRADRTVVELGGFALRGIAIENA